MAIKRKGVELTPRQQAAYVRQVTGWSVKEYQKEYDKLRNRVRNYERATGSDHKINVADLLARHEIGKRAAAHYGEEYKPTALYQAVQQASSSSTGSALSARQVAKLTEARYDYVNTRFKGVVEKSKYRDDIQAALDQYRKDHDGAPMPAREYQNLVEGYSRALEAERAQIAKFNANVSDPLKIAFFHSS